MHFLTAASALFAAALAAPAPQSTDCPNPAHCGGSSPADPATYENIDISDFTARKNNGIQGASFSLSSGNATDVRCEIGAVESLPSEVVACGESAYRFGLTELSENGAEFGVEVYHDEEEGGMSGSGSVPTYCHAGGNGPDDFVCQQVSDVTIVVD